MSFQNCEYAFFCSLQPPHGQCPRDLSLRFPTKSDPSLVKRKLPSEYLNRVKKGFLNATVPLILKFTGKKVHSFYNSFLQCILYNSRPPQRKKKSSAAEHVAVPDDTFLTELHSEMTLQKTISNIEGKFDQGELHYDEEEEEDVMPSAAAEMGAGQILYFI